MNTKILLLVIALTLSLGSCMKMPSTDPGATNPANSTMKDLKVPASFTFNTTKEITVGIVVKNTNTSLSGVPVSIYLDYPGSPEFPNKNARLAGTYLSQSDGRINVTLKVAARQDSLYLKTHFAGIESEAGMAISGTSASYRYGEGNTIKSAALPNPSNSQLKAAPVFTFLSTFDSNGVPGNLVPASDNITQSLLNDLSVTLPDYVRLPVTHPDWIPTANQGDLVLTKKGDVWITFVSEGAGYRNAIGYYTYPTGTPPQTVADITALNIIFPNASLPGSGGNLVSGNKVKLGSFDAGTSLGWFLVQNGWNGTTVAGSTIFYSDPVLNPESDVTKRQHLVLLNNYKTSTLVLGFEDLDRATGGSDEDFNDAIFYITVNPNNAVNTVTVPNIIDSSASGSDFDGDGVANNLDEYPSDPLRASSNYYPGQGQYNSLLVEDLWPSLGDFDFNDLVVDCQFKQVLNAQSTIQDLYINLKVRAIGAGFSNGFGIQLPVPPSAIASVTLTDQSGILSTISQEAGQSLATIIAFNNAWTLLPSTGGGTGVNVTPGNGYRVPVDIQLHVLFNTPLTASALGAAPFNPFIYVDGDRTKEIHLSGKLPTAKASSSFYGQSDDATNPANNVYYKSKANFVWMLELPASFQYTIEKSDISKAYLKMGAWVESGGSLYKDWYLDLPGYRDNTQIYK